MLQLKKQLTLIVLLFTLIQVGSTVAHEYSDAHLNECKLSFCTSHVIIDDFIDTSTTLDFFYIKQSHSNSVDFYQSTKLQQISRYYLTRAPPIK